MDRTGVFTNASQRGGRRADRSSSSLNDLRRARGIVNNWRAAHSLPLDRVRMELEERVAPLGGEALVAQRLKRLSSIDAKLRRFHNMNLARMQDVGGCRAVLPSVDAGVRVARGYADRPSRHRVAHTDDYLTDPRASGYRGIHLVSRFQPARRKRSTPGCESRSSSAPASNMHGRPPSRPWAHSPVRRSSPAKGTKAGCAFRIDGLGDRVQRGVPLVPDTADSRDLLRRDLAAAAAALAAVARLKRYRQALKVLEGHVRNGRAEYFHIVAESWPDGTARVRWNEYARDEREEAIRAFEEVEAAIEHFPGAETVLVRVASVDALRTAYPSYFADTRAFVAELEKAIA